MAVLTVTTFDRSGYDLAGAVAAAAGGDSFANTGSEFVYISNGGVGSITVTLPFASGVGVDGQDPPDRTVTVAAGVRKLIGPFPMTLYNDSNSRANLTYSGVTSVTVAALKPGT